MELSADAHRAGKTVVLLDSNFLMMPFQFGINLDIELERIFGVYDAIVPTSVMRELEGLAKEGGKDGAAARGALRFAARYKKIETPEWEADDALVRLALENKSARWIVATNDGGLRSRLKNVAPVLIMSGKSHLRLSE
ncbi:MAG: twitching motility protein PilT [Candidatus Thermoplasmatota archaeon]|nr:twitching motility protein PilT [Candidatus Thermoplasmatota archaeon]